MKTYNFRFLFLLLISAAFSINADDEVNSKRFYGGEILRAEVQPDNPAMPITINNVSKYEPKSRITTDVGYALVTVSMDSGRSLGIYDYSLVSGKQVFPCVALMDANEDFDGGLWEIKKTKLNRKYTMLFKVQLPPTGQPEYELRFNLLSNKWKDIQLPFVNVKDKPFTKIKDIPATGMLGVNPYKPNPVAATPPVAEDKPKPADKPVAAKKEAAPAPKALSKKEAKQAADKAAWEALMGKDPIKVEPEAAKEEKAEPAKKEPEKKKTPADKGKKDAWDDWK